ncbi:hypothetical protein V8C40DRAFT_143451 [Trichoderma camerunense]
MLDLRSASDTWICRFVFFVSRLGSFLGLLLINVGETVLPFAGYACFPFWAGVAILTETLIGASLT